MRAFDAEAIFAIHSNFELLEKDKDYQKYKSQIKELWRKAEEKKYQYGPYQYCSIKEGVSLMNEFLSFFFKKEQDNFQKALQKNMILCTEKELDQYLSFLETGIGREELLDKMKLTKEEAKDLKRSRGSYTNFFGEDRICVVSDEDYSFPLSLFHEYLHKLYDSYHEMDTIEDLILSEAISYYGEFLFKEFLEHKISYQEANLVFEKIPCMIEKDLLLSKYCSDIFEGRKTLLKEENSKQLLSYLEEDYFPPEDFVHPLGFTFAKNWYQEEENFFEKCQLLEERLIVASPKKVLVKRCL